MAGRTGLEPVPNEHNPLELREPAPQHPRREDEEDAERDCSHRGRRLHRCAHSPQRGNGRRSEKIILREFQTYSEPYGHLCLHDTRSRCPPLTSRCHPHPRRRLNAQLRSSGPEAGLVPLTRLAVDWTRTYRNRRKRSSFLLYPARGPVLSLAIEASEPPPAGRAALRRRPQCRLARRGRLGLRAPPNLIPRGILAIL